MTTKLPTPAGEHRPLSYEDLRRFLLLVVALLVGAMLVQKIAPTLLLFLVVFILAMVLNPLVTGLERRGVKRGLAVVLILIALLGILALVVWLVVPPLLEQVNLLVKRAPDYWNSIRSQADRLSDRYPALEQVMPELESMQATAGAQASKVGTWLLRSTFGVVGALFLGIISLLLLVFTLSNPQPLVGGLLSIVPSRHRDATYRSLERTMQQMTAWAKATLINGAATGVQTGLLMAWIGVQPALVFGVLAFFGEFVPNIGPLVAAIPALFVALGMGGEKALMALAAILFVQQVSTNLLVPFVMGREMQLHPVTIVFFALAMSAIFDITGAILAVPAAAITKILIDEFYLRPQNVPVAEIETQAAALITPPISPAVSPPANPPESTEEA